MATYNQVSYGSQGSDVKKLQELLNKNGANLNVDGIFGNQTQQAVKNYQKANNLAVDGIVGNNTWGALTKVSTPAAATPTTGSATNNNQQEPTSQKPGDFTYDAYEKSDVVKQAEAMLQQQLANKPGAYQSQWQTQLDETLNKILNREKFTYDLNGDALYQQYKDQYMLQGQQAMMDTMGQAQAMTGGYGNSYAQSVGQQTYQGYLQQLNERVPELYQLALNQYNREGDDLYNQYGLYADREDQDYGRYRDTVSDYYTELDRLTDDARYQAETDYGKYMDGYNMAYGQHRDQVSDFQWQQAFDYQQDRDKVADEQWQAQFDEAKRQYDQQYALSKSKVYSSNTTSNPTKDTTPDTPTGDSYDNGGLSEIGVKTLQKALGVTPDGKWGAESQAAAQKKWGVTSAADAYQKYTGGQDLDGDGWKDETKSTYADWDAGDWNGYFATIRQTEGMEAAVAELQRMNSNGLIPTNMVSYASLGARGKLGH